MLLYCLVERAHDWGTRFCLEQASFGAMWEVGVGVAQAKELSTVVWLSEKGLGLADRFSALM